MSDSFVVVGVDCATDPRDVGLARLVVEAGEAHLEEVATEHSWDAIEAKVTGWLAPPTLLALDAPLGWPRALGDLLKDHRAGGHLSIPAHAMFRRETDDVVARQVGKRSLDVGADRLARTAHSALAFLDRLRASTGMSIPLSWEPGHVTGVSAIEVYPAATLTGRRLPDSGYKGDREGAPRARRDIAAAMSTELLLPPDLVDAMVVSDHVLDAAICCWAALDFARADVILPTDVPRAEREGWIWVRVPESH